MKINEQKRQRQKRKINVDLRKIYEFMKGWKGRKNKYGMKKKKLDKGKT